MSGSTSSKSIQNCTTQKGFVRIQKRMCTAYPEFMEAVEKGAKSAISECQFQFQNRRWNCSTVRDKTVFGNVVKDTRESAFIHALSSASVAFSVTKACSKGDLITCGCDRTINSQTAQHTGNEETNRNHDILNMYKWNGCSDNIEYGKAFSKQFVDSRERIKNSKRADRIMMNLHNNNAGRQVISTNMEVKCKCHGVSGSCEMKTCWRSAPSMRKIGELLRTRFDGATEVLLKHDAKGRVLMPKNQYFKRQSENDLVYLKKSPNFCRQNRKSGSYGTRGRTCIRGGKAMDGCDLMCCGRGFFVRIRYIAERCNCKFKWCCSVKCDTCNKRIVEHICK